MKKDFAIQKAGSASNLAKVFGITRQSVQSWGEYLPESRLWQLKVIRPQWVKEYEKEKATA